MSKEDFNSLVDYLHSRNPDIGALEARIVNLESICIKLAKILTDGNGQPSVLAQIESLKTNVTHLKESVQNHSDRFEGLSIREKKQLDDDIKREKENRRIKVQGKTAIIVAVIAAIASLLAAIIVAYTPHK